LPGTGGQYRQESQTLLCGVATLADAQTLEQVLDSLIQVLKPFIGFEHADVVAWEEKAASLTSAPRMAKWGAAGN
jgi:hypothetical protein